MRRGPAAGILLGLLLVHAGAPGPRAATIQVYDDPLFVDSSGGNTAEADTVKSTLSSLGHSVFTFTAQDPAFMKAILDGNRVVVLPELEVGDLAAALGAGDLEKFADFVASGGTLINVGDRLDRNIGLINAVLESTITASGATLIGSLGTAATDTPFIGGPGSLPLNNGTRSLTSIPGGKGVYVATGESPVSVFPFGGGRLVYLGWDWYDAVPLGSQDGGWVEVLDRAVRFGAPPVRYVAVYDDPAFVDTGGGSGAESDTLQATLVAQGHRVRTIATSSLSAFEAWTGGRPGNTPNPVGALLFPELQNGNPSAALGASVMLRIETYVRNGGTLVFFGGNTNDFGTALVNDIFGLSLVEASVPNTAVASPADDLSGTLLADGPATLPWVDSTQAISGLPSGARALYETDTDQVVVAEIPAGAGRIFFVGWDWWNAAPLGVQDSGWLEVLDRLVRQGDAPRRAVLYYDDDYVDTENVSIAGVRGAEAVNVAASLGSRDHEVERMTGSQSFQIGGEIARADLLVVPELELGDLAADFDFTEYGRYREFVRAGGLLVVHGQAGGRGVALVNRLFDLQMQRTSASGPAELAAGQDTLPSWHLPTNALGDDLPAFSATSAFTNLPAAARTLYETAGGEAVVVLVPYGSGAVLLMGWDWFDAAPYGGNSGQWVHLLDVAAQNAQPRTRDVAVFADPGYVDVLTGTSTSEGFTVQASLASLGHRPRPFSGTGAGDWDAALSGPQVALVPELEVSALAGQLDPGARLRLREFVRGGGTLIVHADNTGRSSDLVNDVFGFATAPGGEPPPATTISFSEVFVTRFEGGPSNLAANLSYQRGLDQPPSGSQRAYRDFSTSDNYVVMMPFGLGRVVYLGWDWFAAAPVGGQDGGWLEVLDRAVQMGRSPLRNTVVFSDSAFVDTELTQGEAHGVEAGLYAFGNRVVPLQGTDPDDWAAALAGAGALVVPELEVADLYAALPVGARDAIVAFVERGGRLITMGGGGVNASTRNADLLNGLFGTSLVAVPDIGAPTSLGTPATPFEFGPAQLEANSTLGGVTGLPADARVAYEDAGGTPAVAWWPQGDGRVTWLAWDWAGAAPFGAADQDGGWLDVLERAARDAPPPSRRVRIFLDGSFVDNSSTGGTAGLQWTLFHQGHYARYFDGVDPTFAEATALADVLCIPELENGDLAAALDPEDVTAIQAFVSAGGLLLSFGPAPDTSGFLNAVFGFATAPGSGAISDPSSLTGPAAGTIFWDAPPTLPGNTSTGALANLPPGANALYTVDTGPDAGLASVALMPYGDGRVAYLGWEWTQASPYLTQDDGWQEVLDRIVRTAPAGAHIDGDVDLVPDGDDVCPFALDPAQADADGDGTGDACTCGDVDDDGLVAQSDLDDLRDALAALGALAAPQKCNVRGPADLADANGDGLPDDCDVADAAVAARHLALQAPGPADVCSPAVP